MIRFKTIVILCTLVISFFGTIAQEKGVCITYNTAEFIPTTQELAEAVNIKLPANADSLQKIYDPKSINEKPIQLGILLVNRMEKGSVHKIKIASDSLYSEFDLNSKKAAAIFYFKSKKGEGMDTIRIEGAYNSSENEFSSYDYKYNITGNRKEILGYQCEQIMIVETVTSKIDMSKQEFYMNAWVTNKIFPAIPLQSILMLHKEILPDYTLLEVIRSPYGPGPHQIVAAELKYND